MILYPYALIFGLLLPVANACSSATPPAQTQARPSPSTEEREVATGTARTKFQQRRLLGHYSTLDGGSGFILDRTDINVRAKLDGTSDVKILTAQGGPRQTKDYRSADGHIWLRIDQHGEVLLFQGPNGTQGVEVIRDADAEPLW
jgi:hypothetical protein